MYDNHELTAAVGHITDSEIAAAIRYLDPMPASHATGEGDDTIIVVFVSALIYLLAVLPFVSLYLKTS
jgi:hypothetical protein